MRDRLHDEPFIGALAFPSAPALVEEAKIGVVMGSLVSALVGFVILRFAPQRQADDDADNTPIPSPART